MRGVGICPVRGFATLEFVLVLIPCSLFFVALFWISRVGITNTDVTIESRFLAWEQRDSQAASPFEMRDTGQGRIEESSSAVVKVSPFIPQLDIESSHVVFAGAWQYPHVDLNNSPNWDLQKRLVQKGVESKAAEFKDIGKAIQDLDFGLNEFARLDPMSSLTQQLPNLEGMLDGLSNATIESNQRIVSEKAQSQQAAEVASLKAKAEHQSNIKRLGGILDRMTQDRADKLRKMKELESELKKEKATSERDEEKVEKLEREINKLDKQVDELDKEIPKTERAVAELNNAKLDLPSTD